MSTDTIRVALLTTSFPLRTGSVSGIFIQRLVKSLPTSVSTTVVTPCDTSSANFSTDYQLHCFRYAPWKWQLLAHQPGGIPVALKRSKAMCWVLPIFLGAMCVACFRVSKKADILHANWSVNGAIAGFIGLLLRKPVVTTLRGEDVVRAEKSKLYRYLLVWCLRSNDRLITVSEAIHNLLAKEFPDYQHKISFLPNGVDSKLINTPIPKTRPDGKIAFKLLSIGSLIPRKGVETIIDALGYLHSPRNFKLVVVGDGLELSNLKGLVKKKGLDNIVEFVGQVPPGQVAEYLRDADAFILASYSEGRPNVVLESFAVGVPVIASDINGVQELVRDNETGMRFPPGNARVLASKIEKLQQSIALQAKLSKQGREFILENHLLWEHTGQSYMKMYRKVIDN